MHPIFDNLQQTKKKVKEGVKKKEQKKVSKQNFSGATNQYLLASYHRNFGSQFAASLDVEVVAC